ncbi:MAG TPA: hypothetical protein VHZ52_05510 [Acidobacteriaceae bacterium]|nr:hypothetical protein [Acidobacteriaceae bacterium]
MALSKADEPFWDVAVKQIKKVDQRFWIELSDAGDVPRELIVTAEGHVDAFPVAEQLINLAPTIEGWIFLALKPPMGFNFTTVYEGTFFDPRAMWFLPLERDQLEADFALRIGVPGLNAMDERVALNAVLVILDTGLGERSAALDIQKILLAELVANPESQGYIELVELPDYIRWRKNKLEPSKNRV